MRDKRVSDTSIMAVAILVVVVVFVLLGALAYFGPTTTTFGPSLIP